MPRRVVITSAGVCSSLGFNLEQIIDNLKRGQVHFERPVFDQGVVTCPILSVDFRKLIGPFKDRRYLNRGALFCVTAALEAIRNSKLDKTSLSRAGLFVGTGPNLDLGGECPEIRQGRIGQNDLMALWILRFLPNTPASAISKLTGIHGENMTITTACSASLQAIGEAYRKIKDGYLDLALTGGGDSRLTPGGILAYKNAQALFEGNSDPKKASRPFDKGRKGFVPGEGGAFFLLEKLDHARSRGAEIFAEIQGFGSSMDGYNMTAPHPDGRWAQDAVITALAEARMSPDQIDVVSAHGTSTPLNDKMEGELIDRIYGKHKPLVIALKSLIGHVSAACGALELAIFLACMRNQYLPEIRNLEEPCHDGINFVRKGQSYNFRSGLIENFGFGGQNSALVVTRPSF
jgi:3-oxoacyl-[acyl-carrier-protein] synthase II